MTVRKFQVVRTELASVLQYELEGCDLRGEHFSVKDTGNGVEVLHKVQENWVAVTLDYGMLIDIENYLRILRHIGDNIGSPDVIVEGRAVN